MAGLRTRPLAPPGVLLVEDPADQGPSRVVGSHSALHHAMAVPSSVDALLAVLGEGEWAAFPVILPQHMETVDPGGRRMAPLAAELPWVLLPPGMGSRRQAMVSGDVAADLLGGGASPRHSLNLLAIRYRMGGLEDPVTARVARNILDELGRRLG